MKTTIDLSQFNFGNRQLIQQISDDPETGFVRVIVFDRFEVLDDIKHLRIQGRMHYINDGVILPKFTHVVLSQGAEWIVDNSYKTVELGLDGTPVDNPKYDSELETSVENFPYLKQDAYDNFSKIMFSLLSQLVVASVTSDDEQGFFNENNNEGGDW